ncbi:MAG: class I SAM-dependent methyltransferase, partial [Planctomycetota bacterium]
LEHACAELHLDRSDLRILDWGCGRGRTVAKLLNEGYSAYGLDIDPLPLSNGRQWFEQHGYDPDERLLHVAPGQKVPFVDGFFHVILSEQVLEHVEPIQETIAEMGRLTACGGFGIHVFPAKWRVFEPHLFMPMVHWLPKNSVRDLAIRLCVVSGIEPRPHWPDNQGNVRERAQKYAHYSRKRTFYRTLAQLRPVFSKNGLDFDAVTGHCPMGTPANKRLPRWKSCARRLWSSIQLNFKVVHIIARRRHTVCS